ncbi:hypothetical protein SJAG_05607 [Schizosaccharomyces japonicus yFS275]|uniref:Uncharacterized protein n=1 Tax=Schizosaccharomyces japonicus (strain yFS275 / FY16936) TaxID=402676 RepID=T0TAY8_SCHJY|nr:hypothetical protein SJAG_05607 [Schizosaccharomyces japonicus yFS275]EQC52978.1 hypothetical protein SJAG_05607 [Schizosaccharomyces japonicus yFS275]
MKRGREDEELCFRYTSTKKTKSQLDVKSFIALFTIGKAAKAAKNKVLSIKKEPQDTTVGVNLGEKHDTPNCHFCSTGTYFATCSQCSECVCRQCCIPMYEKNGTTAVCLDCQTN